MPTQFAPPTGRLRGGWVAVYAAFAACAPKPASTPLQGGSDGAVHAADTDPAGDPGLGDPRPADGDPGPTLTFRAGVAAIPLDGPVGVSMAGFGGREGTTQTKWNGTSKGTRGLFGIPWIKALAFEDAVGERWVLLKLPLMSSESTLTDGTIARLKEQFGVDLTGRVVTAAGHSHHAQGRYWDLPDIFGPIGADTFDAEMWNRIVQVCANTVKAALDDLAPAEWAFGYRENWDPDDKVYYDRRRENDFLYGKDPRMSLLGVRRADGTPLAVVVNFGIHGTILGKDNDLLTEDSAAGIELHTEEAFFSKTGKPIVSLFSEGGGGDASPTGDRTGHQGYQCFDTVGELAATTVLDIYDGLTWQTSRSIKTFSRRMDLRYETFGYDVVPEFQGVVTVGPIEVPVPYTWGATMCDPLNTYEDTDPATTMEGKSKLCTPVETLLRGNVPNPELHQTYLTVVTMGNVAVVTVPGEPTYSVVKYLREQISQRTLGGVAVEPLVIGYSQDHLLYFCHPDDWFQGGFESQMGIWGPFASKTLADRELSDLDAMIAENLPTTFVEDSPGPSTARPFAPRALEVSLTPGLVLTEPTDAVRTDTVRFGFAGGDPSLSTPRVHLEELVSGVYRVVPSPSGRPGTALDNSQYGMITHYDPVPPEVEIAVSPRLHGWYVDWQVPIDLPAGTYRLVAVGEAWGGTTRATYTATSTDFAATQSPGAVLTVWLEDTTLALRLTVPPASYVLEESWPISGWRACDANVGPTDPCLVRRSLTVQFRVGGVLQEQTFVADFSVDSQGVGRNLLDLVPVGLDLGNATIEVLAYLASDREPSPISTPLF